MIFWYLGFLYGKFEESLHSLSGADKIADGVVAVALLVYIVIVRTIDFFTLNDNVISIAIRAITSLLGCIGISGVTAKMVNNQSGSKVKSFLQLVGNYTMEIYLLHYLTLNLFILPQFPESKTLPGFFLVIVNFTITVVVTLFSSIVLTSNPIVSQILFGRTTKMQSNPTTFTR